MLRALVSGMLVVVAASLVGTWVVLRGLTFLGEALAHAVIPGAAAALLWGFDPVLGAALERRGARGGHRPRRPASPPGPRREHRAALRGDALDRAHRRSPPSHEEEVERLLFGDIAHADWGDIAVQAVAARSSWSRAWSAYRAFLALVVQRGQGGQPRPPPARSRTWPCSRSIAVAVVSSFTLGREPARVRAPRRSAGHRAAPRPPGVGVHARVGRRRVDRPWRSGSLAAHQRYDTAAGATMAAIVGRPVLRRCSASAVRPPARGRAACPPDPCTRRVQPLRQPVPDSPTRGTRMTDIGGSVEPGFEGVADAFRANFEEHGEVGAATSRVRRRTQGGRPLGRGRRPRRRHALHRGQPAAGVLHHQGRHRGLRQPPRPARRPRHRRAGGRVLARVQGEGQGRHPRALAALPQGRAALRRRHAHPRGGAGLGPDDPGPRGAGAGLGAGHRARLPRHHLRLAGRRGRAADLRQEPRHVLPRRVRGAARPRVLDRPPRRAAGARRAAHPVGRRPRVTGRRPTRPWRSSSPSSWAPTPCSARRSGAPNNVFSDAEGGFNNPGDPRRGDPRRQRRHQRPVPRPLLRRAHRHGGGRPVRPAPHRGAGGQGVGAPDERPGQVPLLRDDLRARVLRGVAVRALRRRAVLRAHRAPAARSASPTPSTASASAT